MQRRLLEATAKMSHQKLLTGGDIPKDPYFFNFIDISRLRDQSERLRTIQQALVNEMSGSPDESAWKEVLGTDYKVINGLRVAQQSLAEAMSRSPDDSKWKEALGSDYDIIRHKALGISAERNPQIPIPSEMRDSRMQEHREIARPHGK